MSAVRDTWFELAKDGQARIPLPYDRDDKGRRGASGSVYRHPLEPIKAIKIYHDQERHKFEEKIRTMVKVKYNRPHADRFDYGWPEAIISDARAVFVGFKMPFFGANWIDLESLMQKGSDVEQKYRIGEGGRLTVGVNLASAIEALHALSVFCIDLKPENIRVNLDNLSVAIIDCDGMSVIDIAESGGKRFFADKSTPEFWAPEDIGVKPENFKNEEAHDRFALAAIIFMLLNRGLHPYQGVMAFEIPGAESDLSHKSLIYLKCSLRHSTHTRIPTRVSFRL